MKKTLLLFLPILSKIVLAQQAPLWKVTLSEPILWQQVTPLGYVVVATSKGLYGVDPAGGKIAWQQMHPSVANIAQDRYEVVTNTPFVAIVSQGANPQHVVLNTSNGKIICNSKDAGISTVVSRYVLLETGNILLYGISSSFQPIAALFDITNGSIKWQKTNMFGKGLLAEKIQGKPLEVGADAIIAATSGGVYKVSTATGDVVWKSPLPKVSGAVSASETEVRLLRSLHADHFYYLNNMYAMAYQLTDGKPAWKQPAKQSGLVDRVIYDPKGLIIASAVDPKNNIVKPKLSMFDYDTGAELWEKGAKLNGTVTHYSYSDKGLVVAMQSEMGNYSINIVNLGNGEFILDKPLRVKGTLQEIRLTDKGVLYLTSNEINILSLTTGTEVFPKSIKAGEEHQVLYADKDPMVYAFSTSDATLYKVNTKSGTSNALASPIKFDDNEIPYSLENRENGVLLSSNQNMTMIGYDGKQIYHTYYPAPTISNFAKAVYGISSVLHSYDAMRYGAASAAFQSAAVNENDPGYRAMYAGFGDLCNQVSNASLSAAKAEMDMIRKRYNATATADGVVFMNTKLDKGEWGLVKISKASGKKESQISFGKNKEPDYSIDDVSSLLFYRSAQNEIACYTF